MKRLRAFNIKRTPLRDWFEYWFLWAPIPAYILLLFYELGRGIVKLIVQYYK